jgi:hypothetical protein
MKKVVSKIIVLGAFILGGMVYFNNNQPESELSDLVIKNLTVLNTANAETGGGTQSGPVSIRDCDGMSNYHYTICEGYNTMACTPIACTSD